jgi:ubiquitin C-terminal hydrolase
LNERKNELYNSSNQSLEYKLHSVLVHEGNVSAGHYYSFLNLNDNWFKCNDTNITKVPEQEVWDVSIGGNNSSAYCLIYCDTSKVDMTQMGQYWTFIPSPIRV